MRAVQIHLGTRAGGVLKVNPRQPATTFREANPFRYTKLLLKMLPIHNLSEIHRQKPKHGPPSQLVRRQVAVPVPVQQGERIIQGILPVRLI